MVLIAGSIVYQSLIERRIYKKENFKIKVDGVNIHTDYVGSEGPTVILESGCGDSAVTWHLVRPKLTEFCKVFSYDRAGIGQSDKNTQERSLANIVKELRRVIDVSNLKGPFIFVGQSLGGLVVLRFALEYPADVAGIVLVDSSHENMTKLWNLIPAINIFRKIISIFSYLAIFGIARLFSKLTIPANIFPPDVLKDYRILQSASKSLRTGIAESTPVFQGINPFFKDLKRVLHNVPLVVLTQGKYDFVPKKTRKIYEETWLEVQRDFLLLSNDSQHVIARNSGHMVHWTEPELVVNAVRNIVTKIGIANIKMT